ncbi:MAG: hypothetical protein Q4A15_05980 [Prevotellaceae bacterium]|nr:hypothetical protein [Prevotellaceae bacterium]
MFNGTSGLSASDVLALSNNDGFGGNNGAWWIIVLALLFGWGNGGYGFGGGAGSQMNYTLSSDFATLQRQLSDGFGATEGKLDSISNGICSLGYDQLSQMNGINTNIMTVGNAIQSQLADCCCKTQSNIESVKTADAFNTAAIQAAIKDCCCESERIAMQSRFDAQQNQCSTLQAIDKLGDRIIDYLSADKVAELTNENQSLKLAASQSMQNNYLISQLRPTPVPAFPVPSPFYYGNGFGYGTTIA